MTWGVGDLAVCVDDSPCRCPDLAGEPWPMSRNSVWRVTWVGIAYDDGSTILRFEGEPQLESWKHGYSACRFRKIRPDSHEGNVEDWELLRDAHTKKAPSPAEREKRILEALFPPRDAGGANNAPASNHGQD